MKLKSFIVASAFVTSLLALGTVNSYALDSTYDLSSGFAIFGATGLDVIDSGGNDHLSFTGLPLGTYNIVFSMNSTFVDIATVFVNTLPATELFNSGTFQLFGLIDVDASPFTVDINGPRGTVIPPSSYNGTLSVTAVPEPGTFLLILVGVGIVCLAARQRKII